MLGFDRREIRAPVLGQREIGHSIECSRGRLLLTTLFRDRLAAVNDDLLVVGWNAVPLIVPVDLGAKRAETLSKALERFHDGISLRMARPHCERVRAASDGVGRRRLA